MGLRSRLALVGCGALALVVGAGAVAQAQKSPTADVTLLDVTLMQIGNAIALLQGQVAGLMAADKTRRVTLNASGGVVVETTGFVTGLSHPRIGTYGVVFAPGAFSATPTCVASSYGLDVSAPSQSATATSVVPGKTPTSGICAVTCGEVNAQGITCRAAGPSGDCDTGISIVCVGPP